MIIPTKTTRCNLILDIDKTLVDICLKSQYDKNLSQGYKQVLTSKLLTLKEFEFEECKFMIAIRKDAESFLEKLRNKYNLYVISHIRRPLLL